MDERVEGHHRIKRCRLVFPGHHVSLLEVSARYEPAGALYLDAGNVEPEDLEALFNEELGRGNSGAAPEIQNSGTRP